MRDGDREGFDPFREEFPAHEPQHIAEAMPRDLLRAWEPSDPPKPAPKQVRCGICAKSFLAQAAWFCGKWYFSSLCHDCGDGNYLPPGFLSESKRPPVRQMSCPNCGIKRGVEPRLHWNLWEYELTCAHCGGTAMLYRRINRACVDCGEDFFVDERRPIRQCHKCAQKKSSINPY